MKSFLQEIIIFKEKILKIFPVKLCKLDFQCSLYQNIKQQQWFRSCCLHKTYFIVLARILPALLFLLFSLLAKDFKTKVFLFAASVLFFIIAEIFIKIYNRNKPADIFIMLTAGLLIFGQVSFAAFQYVSDKFFVPLYKSVNEGSIKVYSGIDYENSAKLSMDYVLSRVEDIRESLKNEFRTDPPLISVMISRNTAEFFHIIKGNSPYSIGQESWDEYKGIPFVTKGNTIIVNSLNNIEASGISDIMVKHQLYYELSHIYYNNYSLNRDLFLKEGFARFLSKKYTGYDKLDKNYEEFLKKWRIILEREYLNTDKNNIPRFLGNYTGDKAYDDPAIWEASGNLSYNLLCWVEENYSSKAMYDLVSELGKGSTSDDIFIRMTGYDLKGAVWHSIMDDWYLKHKVRKALAVSIPDLKGDISRYVISLSSDPVRNRIPGEFYIEELVNWLNINIPIQPEITVSDFTGRRILQTQKSKIVYPEGNDY